METGTEHLTANRIIARTEGRGLFLVMILFSLPFVAWISIPGMSTILGTMIALLAIQLAFRQSPRLPKFLGDRELPPKMKKMILNAGIKFCRWLEKWVRPRRTSWMSWRIVHLINSLLIVFNAVFLALPLFAPPFIGSNAFPSYAIILLSASMMEEDGVMIWFGYLASLVTAAYFVLFGALIFKIFTELAQAVSHWLGFS